MGTWGDLFDDIPDNDKPGGNKPPGTKPNTPTGQKTPGALEQHLSTGATGLKEPISIRQSADSKPDSYGPWQGGVQPSSTSSFNGAAQTSGYTPPPRNAYGPHLAGDLAMRTIGLDATTRVDPYTGQRYMAGNDGTWREAGFLGRDQIAALRESGAMAPVGQQLRDQTTNSGPMSANPALRGGAGSAGMVGNLQPQDAPHFSSLGDFRIPGLGFNAAEYKPVSGAGINLSSVHLPTSVTRTNYGFDYGHPESFPGTKSYGPSEAKVDMPNFQVPNGYQSGPSGFSIPDNGGAFKAFAMPFGIQNATFGALSQSAPAQFDAPSRANGYTQPQAGPGELKPAGMERPGGAGAMMLNGPQTVNINGGGMGMGFNPDTILKDYGRSGLSSDAATRAMMAMALMNANSGLQRDKGMSPLDAFMALNTPSASNYGAPVGSYGNGSGDYGLAGNPGAYGADGPDRGFAKGGTVMAPGTPSPVAPIKTTDEMGGSIAPQAPQQMQQPQALGSAQQAAPSGTENSISPIQSGVTSSISPIDPGTSMGAPRFDDTPAGGGGVSPYTGPNYTLNDMSGYSPAQLATNTQADQQSPQTQQSVYQPFNDALAYLGMMNHRRQNDSSYRLGGLSTPTGVSTMLPGMSAQNLPPGMFYDPSALINSRVSDIKGLQDQLAAYGDPGSIDSLTQQQVPLQQLLNTFGSMNDLTRTIGGFGDLQDPSQYLSQLSGIDTSLGRYNQAKDINTSLAGLGNPGDPSQFLSQLSGIDTNLGRYNQAKDINSKLTGLGQTGDPAELGSKMATLQQQMAPYKAVQDLQTKKQALGPVGDPAYLEQQAQLLENGNGLPPGDPGYRAPDPVGAAQMRQQAQNSMQAALIDQQIATLDPSGQAISQLGTLGSQYDMLKQQQYNAQNSAELRNQYTNQLGGLIKPGEDIDAAIGQLQGQRGGIQQQLSDAQKAQSLRTQYQNQLSGLVQPGENIDAMLGQLQAQRGGIQQSLSDAQKKAVLQSQLGNLQGKVGGNTEAGVQSQMTGLNDMITRSRKKSDTSTQLGNLLQLGVPGSGKLPGFARGANVMAGGIHGSMSGIRGSMSGIHAGYGEPGMPPGGHSVPGYQGRGMVTPEEIVGVGRFSGKPYFRVGEQGPERLQITPMSGSGRLPMGMMNAA